MKTPNPELMHAYGTDAYFLEKSGSLSGAMQSLAPLLSTGMMLHEGHRTERQLQEAEVMNQMFRAVEHQRMGQTIAGFKGASVHDERVKLAEAAGRHLATRAALASATLMEKAASGAELTELEKEALVGILGKGLSMLGKNVGAAGKALGWGATGAIGRGGLAQGIGGAMRGAGVRMARTGGSMARGAAAVAPAATTAATAATAATKAKPWISGLTKAKIGVGALGLGLGYAGYKGLQAAKDYMMQPTAASSWGGHSVAPMQNVNQFGYAAY